jgi:hypothetical protein
MCSSLHRTRAVNESCPKQCVRVLEHAVFETDDYELRTFKACSDEPANILCM